MQLRPMTDADLEYVLALNQGALDAVGPLDRGRLEWIVGLDSRSVVAEHEERVAGFAITLPRGTVYDSTNYRWFTERFEDFGYLDRVVVSPSHRRRGVATLLYDELEPAYIEHGQMALEVNADPPNTASLAFHAARGYGEVGRLEHDDGKTTAMLLKPLR